MRSTPTHVCPELSKPPQSAPCTARSSGASSSTIIASWSLSSSVVGIRCLAASTWMIVPVRYDPVKKMRSEEHTSELQSRPHLVCRLLLEKKKNNKFQHKNESI